MSSIINKNYGRQFSCHFLVLNISLSSDPQYSLHLSVKRHLFRFKVFFLISGENVWHLLSYSWISISYQFCSIFLLFKDIFLSITTWLRLGTLSFIIPVRARMSVSHFLLSVITLPRVLNLCSRLMMICSKLMPSVVYSCWWPYILPLCLIIVSSPFPLLPCLSVFTVFLLSFLKFSI